MKTPLQNLLIVDIETVSLHRYYEGLPGEWQKLWEEKVMYSLPPHLSAGEYYPQRAGILAEFGKVVCICIGYFEMGETELKIRTFCNVDEKLLLHDFIKKVDELFRTRKNLHFTGHNIKEFDIPFLCRRLLINGIPLASFLDFQSMKPWETNIIDTFQYWRFGDYKHYISLKLLAAVLNVPSPKDDIDGSMVGPIYWQEHDLERIAVYCRKDILTVANIILRFKNRDLLSPCQVIPA